MSIAEQPTINAGFPGPRSFQGLYYRTRDRVFNLVLKLVRHVQDAEEITQDVFVDVYRKPEAFRGDAAVATWLYRIAMNKCIDHQRRITSRRKWLGLFGAGTTHSSEAVHFIHPGAIAESKEKTAILFKALQQLPANQQMSWVLSEMEDLSYKEISEVMNVSVSAVESLLVRAKKNIKKILSRLYDKQTRMD